jgi:GxxExxY protein
VYDRALQVGLRLARIPYEGQKVVELKYKDHCVGEGYPDLVVRCGDEKIIVELKAVSWELGASKEQQLRNYMRILQVRYGILINFQHPGLSRAVQLGAYLSAAAERGVQHDVLDL